MLHALQRRGGRVVRQPRELEHALGLAGAELPPCQREFFVLEQELARGIGHVASSEVTPQPGGGDSTKTPTRGRSQFGRPRA